MHIVPKLYCKLITLVQLTRTYVTYTLLMYKYVIFPYATYVKTYDIQSNLNYRTRIATAASYEY